MLDLRHVIVVFTLALLAGCAGVPGDRADETIELPYVSSYSDNPPGDGVPNGWRIWTLSKFKKATEYKLMGDSGRVVVKASARASASGLMHPVKMIVAESGRDKLGAWQEVTRNVVEDFRRAFGETPGEITAIGIMTDIDNTGEQAHAYYGDILFRRISKPRANPATD